MERDKQPILCGTDFSALGSRAVDLAVEAGRVLERPVVLVHVMDTGWDGDTFDPEEVVDAKQVLEARVKARASAARAALARERERHADANVHVALLDGRPAERLLEHAALLDAALIVVSTRGEPASPRPVRDWLLGSTAERALREARCPVLVATSDRPIASLSDGRWLVAMAFDDASERALKFALTLAGQTRARVDVVHVSNDHRATAGDTVEQKELAGERTIEATIRTISEACRASTAIEITTMHGDPVEQIVRASAVDTALVVVGTHARRGLSHAILGSVAEGVTRNVSTPVLVVPPGIE